MRLFVAIDLEEDIRQRLAGYMNGVRGFAPEARWVAPEALHVTLKFIGESEKLEEIKAALQKISGSPTQMSLSGTGFFPTPKAARVFWVGINAGEHLALLAAKIDDALAPLGVEREKRAYTPHLTLARGGDRKKSRDAGFRKLQEKLERAEPPDFGTMTAREFFLYESKTAPSGAVYTKLARFALA